MIIPSRRWFAFRLRTLFVVVAILCAGLGWMVRSLNWIRQRNEFFQTMADDWWTNIDHERVNAPFCLRVFGEPGIGVIVLPRGADRVAMDRAVVLFPEAKVQFKNPSTNLP